MRTNIVLNDKLINEAMNLTGAVTKREVVDIALKELVQFYRRQEIKKFRGKMHWEGDLNEMRAVH